MLLGLGLGMTIGRGRAPWAPSQLGASIYDYWDAEQPSTLTLGGSAVAAWASVKNGYSASQATEAAKPVYSATSFNGRPGLTFDGTDDVLTLASGANFPTGASPVEIWVLVDQQALPADTGNRDLFSYGNASASSVRVARAVNAGTNVVSVQVGNGTTSVGASNSANLSGRRTIRGIIGPTGTVVEVDGVAGPAASVTPSISIARIRFGAGPAGVAGAFLQGQLSFIAVTMPLSASDAAQMLAYLRARAGS